MKLTGKQLKKLIENVLSSERPWWHGPFESDWDREMKKLCDEGCLEACEKIEPRMKGPTDEEWNAEMERLGLIEMKITNNQLKQIIKEELNKVIQEMSFPAADGHQSLQQDWRKDKIEDQINYLFQKLGYSFHCNYCDDEEMIKDLVEQGFIIDDVEAEDYSRGKYYYFNEKKIQHHIFKKAKSMLMDDKTHYYDDVLKMLRHFEKLKLVDCGEDCVDKLEELSGNSKIY